MNDNLKKQLINSLSVLKQCIDECCRGSVIQRNPYVRNKNMKKKLLATHSAIDQVIEKLLLWSADVEKNEENKILLHRYYLSYAFLFDFNKDIIKEENEHLLLMKDPVLLAKFNKLFTQSELILTQLEKYKK